jgi:hypothetical protein
VSLQGVALGHARPARLRSTVQSDKTVSARPFTHSVIAGIRTGSGSGSTQQVGCEKHREPDLPSGESAECSPAVSRANERNISGLTCSHMQFNLESLASLATIAGLMISVFGLLASRSWLVATSLCCVGLAVIVVFYARRMRLAVDSASIIIDGHSIDALNVANLRRRVNRTFFIQEAQHTARIEGNDLQITWQYSGYCRAPFASAMEFSIDSEAGTRFDELDCVAYDLGNDPVMTHVIRPLLVGADGISKKVSIPLLAPLKANQPFSLLLKCTLPRCQKQGFGYYISSLSFAQDRVPRNVVRLSFVGPAPSWVRVYVCATDQPARLLKTLAATRQELGSSEYVDVVEDRPGQSAKIYAFWRDSIVPADLD